MLLLLWQVTGWLPQKRSMQHELEKAAYCVWWLLLLNAAVQHMDVSWIQMKQDGFKLWTSVNYLTPLTMFITISFIISSSVTACLVTVNHCHHHQRLYSSVLARQINSPLALCGWKCVGENSTDINLGLGRAHGNLVYSDTYTHVEIMNKRKCLKDTQGFLLSS